jgi:large subunit ribosomal protein L5
MTNENENPTQDEAKPEKPAKAEKQPKGEKAPKGEKQPKGDKPGKGEKPPKGDKPAKGEKGGKAKAEEPEVPAPTPRLQERYHKEVLPALAKKLGRDNPMALPRLKKIVVNMGVGAAVNEKKYLEEAVDAMKLITGQKPVITKARQSIAGFKLREGMPIGCKVTLRGKRMYEFLDRLVSLALPRVRDFRGLNPNAFDGHGNYSIGLNEQLVFPELNPDKFTRPQGMNITLVTAGGSDDDVRELLRGFGVPLRTTAS